MGNSSRKQEKSIQRIENSTEYCFVNICFFLDPIDAIMCIRVCRPWKCMFSFQDVWAAYDILYFDLHGGSLERLRNVLCPLIGREKKEKSVSPWAWITSPRMMWRFKRQVFTPKDFGLKWKLILQAIFRDVGAYEQCLREARGYVIEVENGGSRLPDLSVIDSLLVRMQVFLQLIRERKFVAACVEMEESNNLLQTIM